MFVDPDQKNWDEVLSFVTFAYNSAIQAIIGYQPYYIVYGRSPNIPCDVILRLESQSYYDIDKYATDHVKNLTFAKEICSRSVK